MMSAQFDEFVYVQTTKTLPPSTAQTEEKKSKPVLHRGLRTMKGAKKPIKAFLSYFQRGAGAANTAFPQTFNLQPNLDSSWASWQNEFDEIRVLSAEILWNSEIVVKATVDPTQTPNTVMVYDPTAGNTLSGVNQALQYEDFQLLSIPTVGQVLQAYPSPLEHGRYCGRMHMRAKVPGGVVISLSETLLSSGMWRPTADANNYFWGAFLSYTSQGGVTCVIQNTAFVRMLCEFRTRR